MEEQYYQPLCVECIEPSIFPEIALYIKRGDNHVLYKDQERKFSAADRVRLENNKIESLYVRSGDVSTLNRYLEESLADLLERDDLSGKVKGKILYQILVSYVAEIFGTSDIARDYKRCRTLVENLLRYISTEKEALSSLQTAGADDFFLYVQSIKVTALSLFMLRKMHPMSHDELIDMGIGAMLHDFGMIFISNDILDKPEKLTDIEYSRIKQHPDQGYSRLKKFDVYSDASLAIVRYHHERVNGTGYPSGLKGDEIPCGAQVAAICDVYCALTTDRPHRKAMPHTEAMKILTEESKGGFNEDLLKHLAEIMGAVI